MRLFITLVASTLVLDAGAARSETWPRFRGPHGDGQCEAAGIPSKWTEEDYLWTVPLAGLGHSSPVVWNERVFVTTADPQMAEQTLLCVDAVTGKELWHKSFAGGPHAMHATNSYATSTPTVDESQVYMAWKVGDAVHLAAWKHDGEPAWTKEIAHLAEHHGFGTSPIVVGDVVCMTNETEATADSAVLGCDRLTGDERWRVPRAAGKTTYATPYLWQPPHGKPLLLSAGMGSGLTAIDPASGAVAWTSLEHDLPDRCVSSPIVAGGLALVSCGSGNNGLHLIAVRPGDDGGAPQQEVYRIKKGVPNIPTPLVYGELLFLWHDRGTVSCVDLATGAPHWLKRIEGKFHSSPIRIGERIFGTSLSGEVIVLAASKEFQELARNDLGDPCTATPAVADGRVYFRTEKRLLCLGAKK